MQGRGADALHLLHQEPPSAFPHTAGPCNWLCPTDSARRVCQSKAASGSLATLAPPSETQPRRLPEGNRGPWLKAMQGRPSRKAANTTQTREGPQAEPRPGATVNTWLLFSVTQFGVVTQQQVMTRAWAAVFKLQNMLVSEFPTLALPGSPLGLAKLSSDCVPGAHPKL